MIRGFDQSLREMIGAARPQHHLRPAFRRHQLFQSPPRPRTSSSGPNLTISDARAPSKRARRQSRWSTSRWDAGGPRRFTQRIFFRDAEDQADRGHRHRASILPTLPGADPRRTILQRLGAAASEERRGARRHALQAAVRGERHRSSSARPSRVGTERFTVVGVFDKRAERRAGSASALDDFVVDPAHRSTSACSGLRVVPGACAARR